VGGAEVSPNDETIRVPVGKTAGDFTYLKDGTLVFKNGPFSPPVKMSPDSVQSFKISIRKDAAFAGAIAEDSDGMNDAFLLDLTSYTSTPMQEVTQHSAAQQIFWSPSGRYMLALCAYEGQRFISVDLYARKVVEGDFLGSEGNIGTIAGDPTWVKGSDVLTFAIKETCNVYDNPDCDREKVLGTYTVALDAKTLAMTRSSR
jgi:hypothetical protein